MTTSNTCPILKDVVAYVDVWSSEKTANYSKPFVQQLEEMGAQVSKTFNKQVTHVVFNNGHPATWRKAKKSDVKLVSALWVGSCYDDRMHVDEELYPALDETNPLLKNKKHRCMQPKYSTERTPENDRRMKKKLDKMMKAIAPKEPIVTDVSPIIIDEENGIVYSPALKRSDYMAQRLKDMKVKRENLSPTASQIFESSSPTELKPCLGCTPTAKLTYDQSDDDSRAAVAEPVYSPDKEEGRTDDFTERKEVSEKSWLSHCCERISSPLKCPDFCDNEGTEGNTAKRRRSSVVKKIPADKRKSIRLLEGSCQDKSDSSKKVKEKRRSHIKSFPPSPNKSEKRKGKIKTVQSFKETKGRLFPDYVNSTCVSSSAELGEAAFELSEQIPAPLQKIVQKTPKQDSLSLSDLVRSFTLSGDSKGAVSVSSDGDDVFEDYFSPANRPQKATRPRLPDLPVEGDIQIPFELDRVPKNRKQSCERTRSLTIYEKQKLEKSRKRENPDQQSNAGSEPQSHPQLDVNESLESLSTNVTFVAKRRRQSTLPFTRTSATNVASTSELPTKLTEDTTVSDLQKNSDVNVLCESRGNECKVAAVLTEIPSEGKENHNQYLNWSLQKMANKTKHLRTLVMTSMPTEKQHTVVQVVKALGGFSIVDRVCGSTTHVVSSGHRRTLNILLGIARGCWVLSFEWILWCLEQRQWVPEEPYELSDLFPAAQICRLQRHLSAGEHQQDLFQSQPAIFVSQHSQPPTQSLMELIQLFGGTVCRTVRQAGICVGKYSGRKPEGSRILSEQWVLDSITHLRQLSYDNYHLE